MSFFEKFKWLSFFAVQEQSACAFRFSTGCPCKTKWWWLATLPQIGSIVKNKHWCIFYWSLSRFIPKWWVNNFVYINACMHLSFLFVRIIFCVGENDFWITEDESSCIYGIISMHTHRIFRWASLSSSLFSALSISKTVLCSGFSLNHFH